jgi:hypothetical protein
VTLRRNPYQESSLVTGNVPFDSRSMRSSHARTDDWIRTECEHRPRVGSHRIQRDRFRRKASGTSRALFHRSGHRWPQQGEHST